MRMVLLTGMGGDRRLTDPVRLPGVRFDNPDHLEPAPGEDLPSYAARVAAAHGVGPEDVVGGVSFGGMVAAEIAARRPVKALVLLGTTVHPERLPASYRWFQRLSPLIPDAFIDIRRWRPLIRARFAPVTEEAVGVLRAMADACPPSRLRAFGRMVVAWRGAGRFACPVLSVHGGRDRVVPLGAAEPGVILKEAGHSFTLTHADETRAAMSDFLAGLA